MGARIIRENYPCVEVIYATFVSKSRTKGGLSVRLSLLGVLGAVLLFSLAILPRVAFAEEEWFLTDKGCKVWGDSLQPKDTATAIWSGSAKNGFATGQGILEWVLNGKPFQRFEGNMLNGKYNGKGILTTAIGFRYEGDFVDGKFNGKGILALNKTLILYEGDFVDGKYNGKGILTIGTTFRYEGDFDDGEFNGKGILTWPNGDRFEGDFVDGRRNGRGIFYSHDSTIIEGRWSNNSYVGP